jgi:hypothetical protein
MHDVTQQRQVQTSSSTHRKWTERQNLLSSTLAPGMAATFAASRSWTSEIIGRNSRAGWHSTDLFPASCSRQRSNVHKSQFLLFRAVLLLVTSYNSTREEKYTMFRALLLVALQEAIYIYICLGEEEREKMLLPRRGCWRRRWALGCPSRGSRRSTAPPAARSRTPAHAAYTARRRLSLRHRYHHSPASIEY